MRAELYWIPDAGTGRLATMPRLRGGDWLEDEVQALQFEGVTAVVSLLTAGEERELDLTGEQAACEMRGVAFISLPVPDRGVPVDQRDVLDIARRVRDLLDEGTGVAIHCRAGIGRASLLAACVLVLGGVPADTAFERISTARGLLVPETPEQRAWVETFEHAHQLDPR